MVFDAQEKFAEQRVEGEGDQRDACGSYDCP